LRGASEGLTRKLSIGTSPSLLPPPSLKPDGKYRSPYPKGAFNPGRDPSSDFILSCWIANCSVAFLGAFASTIYTLS